MTGVLRGRPRARVPQDDSPVMSPLVEKLTSDRHSLICRSSPCVVVMCLISRRGGGQGIDAVCIMKLRRFSFSWIQRLQPETVKTWSLFENLSCNYFFFFLALLQFPSCMNVLLVHAEYINMVNWLLLWNTFIVLGTQSSHIHPFTHTHTLVDHLGTLGVKCLAGYFNTQSGGGCYQTTDPLIGSAAAAIKILAYAKVKA